MKSAKDIAVKWSRVTQQRSQDFSEGVKAPRRSWAAGATQAAGSYKDGVTKAAQEGRFEKGVTAAGDAKWQKKTVSVGVSRWAPGVAVAQADMEAGFAPYADVISKIDLNPRYPKGDPRNFDRVKQIGEALNKKRVGA
jgi:hypothetical protein